MYSVILNFVSFIFADGLRLRKPQNFMTMKVSSPTYTIDYQIMWNNNHTGEYKLARISTVGIVREGSAGIESNTNVSLSWSR